MKSYLTGSPELKLALNGDLVIGKRGRSVVYGGVVLDDINFHECVQAEEFEQTRTLNFTPPEGEFILINYRVTNEFRHPFCIFPSFKLLNEYKAELIIKIRTDFPKQNTSTGVVVELPIPSICQTMSGQKVEFDLKSRKVIWNINKVRGGSELALPINITFQEQQKNDSARKVIGPISMNFEIPMYNVSNLQIRYVRVVQPDKGYSPYLWVRIGLRDLLLLFLIANKLLYSFNVCVQTFQFK
ncbi:mu subunit of AP4-like protein [Reticulomyxa filosa]|uniref:Mu subunit of AP4-like protein n=1 Tax=Reticulomyxa filosa TaxID=46433 RepID=X6P6W1_RETFI|nr:mu subunit of AP4-like protein [Reticulomyxa filosa]|eukprot:ETO33901.1 mu subunit of AP4-like protein [Reticulomyxa filosa]